MLLLFIRGLVRERERKNAILLEWHVSALSFSGQIKPLSLSVVVQGDEAPRCFTITALSIDALREFAKAASFSPTTTIKQEPYLEESEEEEEDGGENIYGVREWRLYLVVIEVAPLFEWAERTTPTPISPSPAVESGHSVQCDCVAFEAHLHTEHVKKDGRM